MKENYETYVKRKEDKPTIKRTVDTNKAMQYVLNNRNISPLKPSNFKRQANFITVAASVQSQVIQNRQENLHKVRKFSGKEALNFLLNDENGSKNLTAVNSDLDSDLECKKGDIMKSKASIRKRRIANFPSSDEFESPVKLKTCKPTPVVNHRVDYLSEDEFKDDKCKRLFPSQPSKIESNRTKILSLDDSSDAISSCEDDLPLKSFKKEKTATSAVSKRKSWASVANSSGNISSSSEDDKPLKCSKKEKTITRQVSIKKSFSSDDDCNSDISFCSEDDKPLKSFKAAKSVVKFFCT